MSLIIHLLHTTTSDLFHKNLNSCPICKEVQEIVELLRELKGTAAITRFTVVLTGANEFFFKIICATENINPKNPIIIPPYLI